MEMIASPTAPPVAPIAPIAPLQVGGSMDYYSIASSFQHLVMTRQMELQNVIINYFQKRFGVKSALANIIILLMITNPIKVYEYIINYFRSIGSWVKWMRSLILAKDAPKEITIEVNYINENAINHLYTAVDWYLRNQSTVITNHDHILGVLKEPINGSLSDTISHIESCYPPQTNTKIVYQGRTINYTKTSENIVIYAPSGEIKKQNYKIKLTSTQCSKEILESFCVYCANQYAKSKVNSVWIQKMYTNQGDKWVEQPMTMNKRKVRTVILRDGMNERILSSVKRFIDTEDWHLERGISYKQSYLFYGPPGTGKTSLIKALSHEIERNIHFLNLSMIKDDDQLNKLMSGIDFKSTIIVMEDIDVMSKVTHARTDVEEEVKEDTSTGTNGTNGTNTEAPSKLTLACLLNQFDGIKQTHGMILIMTSNHPEVLDAALIRDGRVDEKILFGCATLDQIYKMFKNFYNGSAPSQGEINQALLYRITDGGTDLTPAMIENAMRRHYKEPLKALECIAEKQISDNGLDLSYLNAISH